MDQCEYSKPSTGLEKHILDLDNYTHNEIAKIYNYIDSKIIIFLQNNTQSINELQNRVCNMEDKLQQATQLCELKCNDVIAIKRQIDSLKIQENDESIKLRNTLDEKDTQKSEKKANLSESSTSTSYLDDIEFLKSELKNIKEQLNSSPFSNQKIYLESDEEIPHHMKEESYEVNSNILTIPSRITQIISQTLNSADQSSANIILEFSDSTESAEESSQSFNEREIELAPVASEETLFGTSNEDEIKFNELSQKVEQLIQENDSLKKDVAALKQASAMSAQAQLDRAIEDASEALRKSMDAAMAADDARSEAAEVAAKTFDAISKANAASFMSAEAEFRAAAANEKADLIVSDNNKMNVDIRCLKYEVKKLRARVRSLEESDSVDLLDDKLDIFAEKVAQVSAKIKRLKAEVKRLRGAAGEDQQAAVAALACRVDEACVQSARACEIAAKADKAGRSRAGEVMDRVDSLAADGREVKADVAALRQEVERLKDWRRQEEEKPQRRFGRRKKASTILI